MTVIPQPAKCPPLTTPCVPDSFLADNSGQPHNEQQSLNINDMVTLQTKMLHNLNTMLVELNDNIALILAAILPGLCQVARIMAMVEGGLAGICFLYGLNFEPGASLLQGSAWYGGQGRIWVIGRCSWG